MKAHWYKDGLFEAEMSDLIGRVFSRVTATDDTITMVCDDGTFTFYHEQDCCEGVKIESIVGYLQDLVGTPILLAEEVIGETAQPVGWKPGEYTESFTWTFYKLASIKGYVDIRWLGESNGYYSESVSLVFHAANPANTGDVS